MNYKNCLIHKEVRDGISIIPENQGCGSFLVPYDHRDQLDRRLESYQSCQRRHDQVAPCRPVHDHSDPGDLYTVGCFNEAEAEEDIEISLAAIERRLPDIEKRASPNAGQDAFGG